MSIDQLEFVERCTGDNPTHAVIWLHGLGADGFDFEAIVPELNIPADKSYRFIFPHAPFQRITINNDKVMRAWYDIRDQSIDKQPDIEGINDSSHALMGMIEQQIEAGIDASKIVIAGFSQGGAIALNAGLRYHTALAGILALSTYLPVHDVFPEVSHDANRKTPIFMAHGTADDVVSYMIAEKSRTKLESMDYPVDWHSYDIAHGVSPEELNDISQWLQSVLA